MKYTLTDIKEAIKHCEEVAKKSCTNDECKIEHLMLKTMLEDLLEFKKGKKTNEKNRTSRAN